MILSLLFCIPNPEEILSTTTGQPLIELIYQSTGSKAAAIVFACGLTVCFINGTIGSVASGSRLLWAMGRDGGAPFSQWYDHTTMAPNATSPAHTLTPFFLPSRLAHVHPRYNIPINAILACAAFNVAFGLLYLGPAIAFNAYISSCTIFLNCSYAAPALILLLRGRHVLTAEQGGRPQFYMGHRAGWAVNAVAVVYVGVTSVFFTFPAAVPVSADTMSECSRTAWRLAVLKRFARLCLGRGGHLHRLRHGVVAVQAEDVSRPGESPLSPSMLQSVPDD